MMKNVYIVAAKRSAVTKALKGSFKNLRPDELLAIVIKDTVESAQINPSDIDDVVIGCAFPEAEQGLNIARVSALLAGLPDTVPGVTINRYCSSGLNSIAIAANSIQNGECEVVIAGGIESMSMIPMGGNKLTLSPSIFAKDENVGIAYGMGITAENVAKEWNIVRKNQDEFALDSNKKAVNAIKNGYFKEEIIPIEIIKKIPNLKTGEIIEKKSIIDTDECPYENTNEELLAKLKPAFAVNGSVTAGNSSQMSDGASVLILVSEEYLQKHKLTAIAKFLSFAVCGVDPKIMGIGPIKALPKALEKANLSLEQIDWIELNEAFAAQSLAVIQDLKLDKNKVNPYGGAIALGHPLGATGAILTTKILHGMRRNKQKYGVVTMCIGNGMGAAGVFEVL
jgi:acetyl-CoA acyltransferase